MFSVPWLRMPPPPVVVSAPPPESVRPERVAVTFAGMENSPKPPSPAIVSSVDPGPWITRGTLVLVMASVPSAGARLIVWDVAKTVEEKLMVSGAVLGGTLAGLLLAHERAARSVPEVIESAVLVTT